MRLGVSAASDGCRVGTVNTPETCGLLKGMQAIHRRMGIATQSEGKGVESHRRDAVFAFLNVGDRCRMVLFKLRTNVSGKIMIMIRYDNKQFSVLT